MKTNHFKKQIGGVLVFLLCAALPISAGGGGGGGGRGGGGGGGGGGRGGGGGGFGGGGGAAGGGAAFAGAAGGGGGGGGRGGGGGTSANSSYNQNGLAPTAQIYVDPDTHKIIVIADEKTREKIEEMIKALDVPVPQVNIKVVFLEVDDSAALDIGVQGQYTGFVNQFNTLTGYMTNFSTVIASDGSASLIPTSITPTYSSVTANNNFGMPGSLAGAGGPGGIYTFTGNDFSATLQAVATKGKARVLSRPSIMARDGQMAEIVVGQSVYLPSSVSLTSIGSTVGTSTTVPVINGSYQNVGIQLDVLPYIQANDMVQMILQPQITSIDTSTPGQVIQGGSVLSSAVYAPNLNKRSANTVVVTPNGQSVVIGGLISNDKASSETKIPLLGDIPILGHLFKFNNYSNKKNELLICLTPHIVKSPVDLPDMTPHEMGQTPLITNAVPSMDLERYLDRLPIKK